MSIKAESLTYFYEGSEAPAIRSVSIEVKKGKLAVICGGNGSGKSTLLRCLAGLTQPSCGRATIGGREAGRSRQEIGFAIQFPERALFERTAFDDLAFGPRNMGMPADEVRRRAENAAMAVGIGRELLGLAPRSLSHGQKRLLAIACAIAHGPEYLFLDEPAAGLDSPGRKRIIDLIGDLCSHGMTIVVASHDPAFLLGKCSRLIALEEGRVLADGPPSYEIARCAGIQSDTMELVRSLNSRGMQVGEPFSPEELANRIAEAVK